MECIFCQISSHELEASFVYEDELVFGIMSLDQPNPYKVLVVPRAHRQFIYDLGTAESARIFQVAVKLATAVRDVSGCEGLNIVQSNGTVGQQDLFHFHMHILPRFTEDDIELKWPATRLPRAELDRLADGIRLKLSEL